VKERAERVHDIVRQFEPEFKHACAADVQNVCKELSRRAQVLKRTEGADPALGRRP